MSDKTKAIVKATVGVTVVGLAFFVGFNVGQIDLMTTLIDRYEEHGEKLVDTWSVKKHGGMMYDVMLECIGD